MSAQYIWVSWITIIYPLSNPLSSLQPGPPPLWLTGGLCPGLQTVGSVHHRPRVWKALFCLVWHEQWRGMDRVSEATQWVWELLSRLSGLWNWVWKCEREHWLGLKKIHCLTSVTGKTKLWINLDDFAPQEAHVLGCRQSVFWLPIQVLHQLASTSNLSTLRGMSVPTLPYAHSAHQGTMSDWLLGYLELQTRPLCTFNITHGQTCGRKQLPHSDCWRHWGQLGWWELWVYKSFNWIMLLQVH